MSIQAKVLYNSYRFSAANSARVDIVGMNRGQISSDGRFGFDCSGFVHCVFKESGFAVPAFSTRDVMTSAGGLSSSGESWQQKLDPADVRSGDLVWFSGHVGFVVRFDPEKGVGVFRSSTGSNNEGKGVEDIDFSVSSQNTYWGGRSKNFFSRIHSGDNSL